MIQGCFPEGGKWNFSKTSYGYNPKNTIKTRRLNLSS